MLLKYSKKITRQQVGVLFFNLWMFTTSSNRFCPAIISQNVDPYERKDLSDDKFKLPMNLADKNDARE